MDDTCPDELQEQIKRVLEFVVDARRPECCVHCPRQGGMRVRVQEKSVRRHPIPTLACCHASTVPVRGSGGIASPGRHSKVTNTTHPRSSRNRQMTLATTSSFLSSTLEPCAALIFVRDASFSDAVAPRQSEKSIVDDCASKA